MAGCVYVVWAEGTDLYKIGSAKNPEKRLRGIQNGCPFPARLLHSFPCKYPRLIERSVHHFLREYRGVGEWFKLTDSDLSMLAVEIPILVESGKGKILKTNKPNAHARTWTRQLPRKADRCRRCHERRIENKLHKLCLPCYQWLWNRGRLSTRPYIRQGEEPPQ